MSDFLDEDFDRKIAMLLVLMINTEIIQKEFASCSRADRVQWVQRLLALREQFMTSEVTLGDVIKRRTTRLILALVQNLDPIAVDHQTPTDGGD